MEKKGHFKVSNYNVELERDKLANRQYIDMATSTHHEDREKIAAETTDLVQERIREKAYPYSMFSWFDTTNEDLVPQLETEENIRYIDYEVDSPASLSMGLYGNPHNYVFAGRRGAMKFHKIVTPRMQKDTNEMRTYTYDIRKILGDNIIRDMSITLNNDWIAANMACIGLPNSVSQPWQEAPQWITTDGGYGRQTIPHIKECMITAQGDRGFEVSTLLMNTVTALQPAKLGREEMGGDLAQSMIKDGVVEDVWGGLQKYITLNTKLIPNGTIWGFTDEKHYIRCSHLQELTMRFKSEDDQIEFYASVNLGMLIVNNRNVIRYDLLGMAG